MRAVKVWVVAGALAVLIGTTTASAAADTVSKSDSDDKSEPIETVAIDAGTTGAWPYSLYGNFGILFAPPAGLDVSGFRLRFEAGGGQYSYPQDSVRIYGLSEDVNLLAGYSLNWDENSILLMAGGAFEHAQDLTSPAFDGGVTAPVPPGTHFGLALKTEVNLKPTEQSILYADANYSTAVQEYYIDLKAGYAAFSPKIYVGPKVVFLGAKNFNQYRLGAFIGGMKVGKVELEFSGGYLQDSIQGSGFFAGADLYVQY